MCFQFSKWVCGVAFGGLLLVSPQIPTSDMHVHLSTEMIFYFSNHMVQWAGNRISRVRSCDGPCVMQDANFFVVVRSSNFN